jgi:hypothetical protein
MADSVLLSGDSNALSFFAELQDNNRTIIKRKSLCFIILI